MDLNPNTCTYQCIKLTNSMYLNLAYLMQYFVISNIYSQPSYGDYSKTKIDINLYACT